MRKVLLASILGFALSVTSSYGDGYIDMQNYDYVNATTPVYAGVTYAAGQGAISGEYIGSANPYGIEVELFYSLTGAAGSFQLAAGSQTGFYAGPDGADPSHDGGSPSTDGAGMFLGPVVKIPGYVSGPAYFYVQAFSQTDLEAGGRSAVFSVPLNSDPGVPPPDLLNLPPGATGPTAMQPFTVVVGPEPSTPSLFGLAAALTFFLRRKQDLFQKEPQP